MGKKHRYREDTQCELPLDPPLPGLAGIGETPEDGRGIEYRKRTARALAEWGKSRRKRR